MTDVLPWKKGKGAEEPGRKQSTSLKDEFSGLRRIKTSKSTRSSRNVLRKVHCYGDSEKIVKTLVLAN